MITKLPAHTPIAPRLSTFLVRMTTTALCIGFGALHSYAANSITIQSPTGGSNVTPINDNLTVAVTYASGGGGSQTPTWAYRIDSGFPGYGSPHGGTQVTGTTTWNDFLLSPDQAQEADPTNGATNPGQIFTAGVTGQLGKIQLAIHPSGAEGATLNIRAFSSNVYANMFDGSILATSEQVTEIGSDYKDFSTFNFTNGPTLTVGQKYVIQVLNANVYEKINGAYAGGHSDSGVNTGYGADGAGVTSKDLKFKTFMVKPHGTYQVNVALLDQSGNLHNPPAIDSIQVNYQSAGGGYQSGGGDSIVITSPGNGSNADQHTDLSVTVTYASGGGGYQTPTWAYLIDSGFPGYGSPHGGTQVIGVTNVNDFLSGQPNGMRQVNVALLDQGGNLHNPPIVQTVSVNYQSGGGNYQSGGGGYAYTGPYQSPTGNFKTDTRNALFDDFIEFKGLQSIGKLKHDYNTSTYFNQSIDTLINQLISLPIPPSTSRGDAVDAWIAANFGQSDHFDHHKTMQSFNYALVANVDLNKSSELKALAANHGSIYFQVYVDQNVTASGKLQSHSIWALSIENGDNNRSNLIVDMAGKTYNGDFDSYWFNTHGIETWNSTHWHETSYSTSSAGIDSLLLAHPVIHDPTAEVHTIKPFDFISDGQVDLKSPSALSVLAKSHKRIYFQQYFFPETTLNQSSSSSQQPTAFDPLDLVAGQERDQGIYQSGAGGYQSGAGGYQTPGMAYQSSGGGFVPYTGPYSSPTYDFKIDSRNALFDDFIENVGTNSVAKLKSDYNTTKAFNDSINSLTGQLQGLATPPSTARGDAIDQWIKSSFDQVKDLDPNHEPAFAWALSIEDADGNKSDLVVDMFGKVYEANFESYWLAVYGVPTHNEPNWSEIEYNATTEGIAKLYRDHPFIDPGIVMENFHKLAVLETNAPQIQGNVIQLSGSLLETNGTSITRIGFLVSSQGHPFMNDPHSQVILATTQNNMISASHTVSGGGTYYVRAFAETKGGISEGPVRKIEIFLDSHSGNDPQAKALSLIKEGTKEMPGGWRQSSWFGLYLDHGNGWIYHQIHGYLYLSADGNNGIWAYDQERGWFWSTKELYPFIYEAGKAAWLYMLGVNNGKAVFFNYATSQVEF